MQFYRWKFYIHGAIDGYSRLNVYLKVADNKCAATVCEEFTAACLLYGVPVRMRMDAGGENAATKMLMDNCWGPNHVIIGSSVHNQRIERLWRDVFDQSLDQFHQLFHTMEQEGVLNIESDVHLYALHSVF